MGTEHSPNVSPTGIRRIRDEEISTGVRVILNEGKSTGSSTGARNGGVSKTKYTSLKVEECSIYVDVRESFSYEECQRKSIKSLLKRIKREAPSDE